MFGSGVRNINIVYRAGKENGNAGALSRCPPGEQPADPILDDTQAAIHTTEMSARELLAVGPNCVAELGRFQTEQQKDPDVQEIIASLSTGKLPDCDQKAKRISAQAPSFVLVNGVLCTSWTQKVEIASGVWFLDSYERGSGRKTTVALWQGISLESGFTKHWPAIGGGRGCMLLSDTVRPVHSVLL